MIESAMKTPDKFLFRELPQEAIAKLNEIRTVIAARTAEGDTEWNEFHLKDIAELDEEMSNWIVKLYKLSRSTT